MIRKTEDQENKRTNEKEKKKDAKIRGEKPETTLKQLCSCLIIFFFKLAQKKKNLK